MPKVNVKDKRRQQLIEANIASIAKRGYTETTIAHVSQGAGMSRGIVNFYFSTKESMMQETLKFLLEDYAALWQEAAREEGAKPAERLKALIAAHFHKSWCNPKRLAVWSAFLGHAGTHIDYRKQLMKSDAEILGALETLLAESLSGGAAENAGAFALSLHAMIRGAWVTYLLNPTLYEREQLAEQVVACMEHFGDGAAASVPEKRRSRPELVKSAPEAPEAQLDFGDLFAMVK